MAYFCVCALLIDLSLLRTPFSHFSTYKLCCHFQIAKRQMAVKVLTPRKTDKNKKKKSPQRGYYASRATPARDRPEKPSLPKIHLQPPGSSKEQVASKSVIKLFGASKEHISSKSDIHLPRKSKEHMASKSIIELPSSSNEKMSSSSIIKLPSFV